MVLRRCRSMPDWFVINPRVCPARSRAVLDEEFDTGSDGGADAHPKGGCDEKGGRSVHDCRDMLRVAA